MQDTLLRSRRFWIVMTAAAAVAVAAGVYWFGPQHLFIDRRVDEALPGAVAPEGATTLSNASFSSLAHETSGTASIVELDDGRRFLRIEDLQTSSGPDLRVYLSEAAPGDEGALDDAFVDLGGLKGNQGNQNYPIPDEVDLEDIGSVTIWCRRFSVGFGVAPVSL
jgi:hypothetical protein